METKELSECLFRFLPESIEGGDYWVPYNQNLREFSSMFPMLVDPKNLLEYWNTQKKKLLQEIQGVRKRMAEVEGKGSATYEEWLAKHHAGLITHIQSSREVSRGLEEIVRAVESEIQWGGKSKAEAYASVQKRKEEGKPLVSDEAREAEVRSRESERLQFHEIPDSAFSTGEEESSDFASSRSQTPSGEQPVDAQLLKELYRELARRLHPDANDGQLTESTRRLWHEVQSAYKRKDIRRLTALRALLQKKKSARGEGLKEESVSELIEVVQGLRSTLRDLRASEQSSGKSRVSLFLKVRASPEKLKRFSEEVKRELQKESENLGARIQYWKLALKRQAKASAKKGRKP
jgi:hypothetical protein